MSACSDLVELGFFFVTLLLGIRATRGKLAACWRVDEVGWPARDGLQTRMLRLASLWNRSKQSLGLWVTHVCEQSLGRCFLNDLAGVHHRNFVGTSSHNSQVVGHHDHCHIALSLLLGKQVQDLVLHGHV